MADAKYFVKKVETCSACKGEKRVQHPAWAEYWEEHKDKPVQSYEYDLDWFEKHGFRNVAGFRYESNSDGIPFEEVACGECECEGEGEIESEVDLLEILPELMKAHELGTLSTTA